MGKLALLLGVFGVLLLSSKAQNNATHRTFPEGFLFGTSSSTYQIEGSWNLSGKGENIWDRLVHTTDLIKGGGTGDLACDSYNKYPRDVEMLKELGVDYYRFSLSWSRILPNGFDNFINPEGIAYYNKVINLLIENNITPVINLYIWDLPQPLQDIGGWPNPLMEKYFEDFARVAFDAFGDRVTEWLTFNEPNEICQAGYGDVYMAPALNSSGVADYLCGHTLLKAHARVYHLYNDVYRPIQNGRIGWTLAASWCEPENLDSAADREAAETAFQFVVGWFAHPVYFGDYPEMMKQKIANRSREQGFSSSRLPAFTPEEIKYIKGTADYLGINHYTSSIYRPVDETVEFPSPSYYDDMGVFEYWSEDWPSSPASSWLKVVPWGFTKLLVWLKNEYLDPEIIIFENGFSDLGGTNDTERVDYFSKYLNAMLDAMEQGVKVSAYTAWTLMDNFEWMAGYTEKFGLYSVDFNDPARPRTAKDSAKYYNQIITTKTIARV